MEKRTKCEDKYIKTNRTFPVGNTVLLIVILAIQIGIILFAVSYEPMPQDLIHKYQVSVEPLKNGTLDIEYTLVWEALDQSEELTWVEIGMANDNYVVYPDSLSDNIAAYEKQNQDGDTTLRLDFAESYLGGDQIVFSFRVNQRDMLCRDDQGYFYEFIPGWFNHIQVQEYKFTWIIPGKEDYVLRGSLDYGEYERLYVRYDQTVFDGCKVVSHTPFDPEGAYNGLEDDKNAATGMCFFFVFWMILAEVYIVDSYVSYGRGRGFLTGYGHHVHTYGRTNPYYTKARDRHMAQNSSRGGRSGGCACACACACAGGGRAGCSQKDGYNTNSYTDIQLKTLSRRI